MKTNWILFQIVCLFIFTPTFASTSTTIPTPSLETTSEYITTSTEEQKIQTEQSENRSDNIRKIMTRHYFNNDQVSQHITEMKNKKITPIRCIYGHYMGNSKSADLDVETTHLQDLNEQRVQPKYEPSSYLAPVTPNPRLSGPLLGGPPLPISLQFMMKSVNQITKENDHDTEKRKILQPVTSVQQKADVYPIRHPYVLHKTVLPSGRTLFYTYRSLDGVTNIPTTAVPEEISTPSTTTTLKPEVVTVESGEPLYQQQIRFVLPYALQKPMPLSEYPWQIDQYAYFPQRMRPAFMNVPVPYEPTYHMIRTLALPNESKSPINLGSDAVQSKEKK